jgi:hypothetical protein
MPCSQHQGWGDEDSKPFKPKKKDTINYDNIVEQLKEREEKMKDRNHIAMLCALFNDLKNRGIYLDVLETASKDGNIDFSDFIQEHEKEDVERLKKDLSKYSKHEKQMMVKILNNEL